MAYAPRPNRDESSFTRAPVDSSRPETRELRSSGQR
jgi:hypothetical protein